MQKNPFSMKKVLQAGLIGGVVAMLMALVGMVAAFGQRYIISGVITMGQVLFLAPILLMVYLSLQKASPPSNIKLVQAGLLGGLVGSAVLAGLVLLGNIVNLRVMLINASPELYKILTFNQSNIIGALLLLVIGLVIGTVAVGVRLFPERLRNTLIQATFWVFMIGLLRDLIVTVSYRWGPLAVIIKQFFAVSGLIFNCFLTDRRTALLATRSA